MADIVSTSRSVEGVRAVVNWPKGFEARAARPEDEAARAALMPQRLVLACNRDLGEGARPNFAAHTSANAHVDRWVYRSASGVWNHSHTPSTSAQSVIERPRPSRLHPNGACWSPSRRRADGRLIGMKKPASSRPTSESYEKKLQDRPFQDGIDPFPKNTLWRTVHLERCGEN
jgi:hypothetical protein